MPGVGCISDCETLTTGNTSDSRCILSLSLHYCFDGSSHILDDRSAIDQLFGRKAAEGLRQLLGMLWSSTKQSMGLSALVSRLASTQAAKTETC